MTRAIDITGTDGQEIMHAREASARLRKLLSKSPRELSVRIHADGEPSEDVSLPASAVHILAQILGHMAEGRTIRIVPMNTELTTQQAAELLNVSRPFLIELLEKRKIPFRRVGTHRRVRLDDLLRFKEEDDEERRRVLDELSVEGQEMGMGY